MIGNLDEYAAIREIIKNDGVGFRDPKTGKKSKDAVIIEYQDGEFEVLRANIRVGVASLLLPHLKRGIESLIFIIDGEEYEFSMCG
jgi:hypothetical protein